MSIFSSIKFAASQPTNPTAMGQVLFLVVEGALVVSAGTFLVLGYIGLGLCVAAVTCIYSQAESHKHFTDVQMFVITIAVLAATFVWGLFDVLFGNYESGWRMVFVASFAGIAVLASAMISGTFWKLILKPDADEATPVE